MVNFSVKLNGHSRSLSLSLKSLIWSSKEREREGLGEEKGQEREWGIQRGED